MHSGFLVCKTRKRMPIKHGDFWHFAEEHCVHVDLGLFPFGVLPKLFEAGEAYIEEVAALKEASKRRPAELVAKRKRLAGGSLRERQPWDKPPSRPAPPS